MSSIMASRSATATLHNKEHSYHHRANAFLLNDIYNFGDKAHCSNVPAVPLEGAAHGGSPPCRSRRQHGRGCGNLRMFSLLLIF